MTRDRAAPRACAAATKSRALSASTSPRTRMANVGMKVTARAPITFQRLAPRKAVIVRASTSEGKTSKASIARMRMPAPRPGATPATSPIAVPVTIPAVTERRPTTMEIRAPPMI